MKFLRYQPTLPIINHGSLLDELDRLFEAGFPASGLGAFPVDIYEDAEAVHVRTELPGFRKQDLDVAVAENVLTIRGRTSGVSADPTAAKTEADLERSIALPENLQYDRIAATYENGVLTVTLPKRAEVKPRTVAVEVK